MCSGRRGRRFRRTRAGTQFEERGVEAGCWESALESTRWSIVIKIVKADLYYEMKIIELDLCITLEDLRWGVKLIIYEIIGKNC